MNTLRSARRDERGLAAPSPLVMLSVIAVAMAGIAFVATGDVGDKDKVQTVSEAPAAPSPSVKPAPLPPTPSATPAVNRAEVLVEVYNNSGITGLAGRTAGEVSVKGWQVVGSDNWMGTIPATTIYHGPQLAEAAQLLAKDLGVERIRPAVDPMRPDRLTVILTADRG